MRALMVFTGLAAAICLAICPVANGESSDSVTGELSEKCTIPQTPTIPNGKQATKDEMLAAQRSLKAYIEAGDKFLACLEEVESGWTEAERIDKKPLAVMVHNKVVDNMTELADLFNSALRAYKGRQ